MLNRKMLRYCLLPKATVQVMGPSSPPLSHRPGVLTDSPCALHPTPASIPESKHCVFEFP